MGCRCAKAEIAFQNKFVNIEEPLKNDEFNNDEITNNMKKENTFNLQNRINSINTGSHFENLNNINQSNFVESSDFRKASFFKFFDRGNKNSILEEDKNFDYNLFRLINAVRKDPLIMIERIGNFIKNINHDENKNKSFYLVNKKTKINLLKGREAFLSACEYLKELSEKIKNKKFKLNDFEFIEDLKFPFPQENPTLCNTKEYISDNILLINKKGDNKYKIKGFHYDMSTNNAEISLILQIVDDNNSNGKRRNIIFDDKIKYIGISHGRVKDELFCTYLVFAS